MATGAVRNSIDSISCSSCYCLPKVEHWGPASEPASLRQCSNFPKVALRLTTLLGVGQWRLASESASWRPCSGLPTVALHLTTKALRCAFESATVLKPDSASVAALASIKQVLTGVETITAIVAIMVASESAIAITDQERNLFKWAIAITTQVGLFELAITAQEELFEQAVVTITVQVELSELAAVGAGISFDIVIAVVV